MRSISNHEYYVLNSCVGTIPYRPEQFMAKPIHETESQIICYSGRVARHESVGVIIARPLTQRSDNIEKIITIIKFVFTNKCIISKSI